MFSEEVHQGVPPGSAQSLEMGTGSEERPVHSLLQSWACDQWFGLGGMEGEVIFN